MGARNRRGIGLSNLESILGLLKSLKNWAQDSAPKTLYITDNRCISAGIYKQSVGARKLVKIGISYWPARLHHSLAELAPGNRFLGSLKVYKFGLRILLLKRCTSQITCRIRAGIFEQSMGARNRVGLGMSYRPARLHSLAELVPWNRFLGSLKV